VDAVASGDPSFSVPVSHLGVAAGAEASLAVEFTPSAYGDFEGSLTLTTNDLDTPTVVVQLAGVVLTDQDGDGHDAVAAGGDDCQDSDPSAYPGAPEDHDLADDDCDGLVDEDFLREGDVWVTEVMAGPDAVSDDDGEWFEVYNATPSAIDLQGWTITSGSGGRFTVGGPLVVQPGETIVLGGEANAALNGGAAVDYEWPASAFILSDVGDRITLFAGELTVGLLEFNSTYDLTTSSPGPRSASTRPVSLPGRTTAASGGARRRAR
jgi:hypothetical protein